MKLADQLKEIKYNVLSGKEEKWNTEKWKEEIIEGLKQAAYEGEDLLDWPARQVNQELKQWITEEGLCLHYNTPLICMISFESLIDGHIYYTKKFISNSWPPTPYRSIDISYIWKKLEAKIKADAKDRDSGNNTINYKQESEKKLADAICEIADKATSEVDKQKDSFFEEWKMQITDKLRDAAKYGNNYIYWDSSKLNDKLKSWLKSEGLILNATMGGTTITARRTEP